MAFRHPGLPWQKAPCLSRAGSPSAGLPAEAHGPDVALAEAGISFRPENADAFQAPCQRPAQFGSAGKQARACQRGIAAGADKASRSAGHEAEILEVLGVGVLAKGAS